MKYSSSLLLLLVCLEATLTTWVESFGGILLSSPFQNNCAKSKRLVPPIEATSSLYSSLLDKIIDSPRTFRTTCFMSSESEELEPTLTEEEKKKAIGNLVENDEWDGLGMELSQLVKLAVTEDLKKNARDFLGKDDYKVGDFAKEVDSRVKDSVAKLREKDEYELGDLVMAMDELSKDMTEELTGKPYEAGDLSKEIDSRIKAKVAEFCGKDEYEAGDLTKEIASRVESSVAAFTGKDDYEFGDISREIESRRKEWVKNYLGEEAAENYQFGDLTKKAISQFTGKDEYQFGDITKKIAGNLFGKKKKKEED